MRFKSIFCDSRGKAAWLATFLLSLPISGCRFGNQVIQAEDPSAMSGFYKTEAKTMSICTMLQGTDWRCNSAPTSMIPGTIQTVMTNPVYVSANTVKATAFLVPNSLDTSNYFQMTLARSGELTADPIVGSSKALWNDEACQTQLQLSKEGQVQAGKRQTQGSFEVSGSVDFDITVVTVLSGDCGPTLSDLKACYQDATKCPGSDVTEQAAQQQSVQDYFAPYIDYGVLSVNEIPQLVSTGWSAGYH